MKALTYVLKSTRSNYHVTLGELDALSEQEPLGMVIVDGKGGLGGEHSYRGYYCDLSFRPSNVITTTSELRESITRAYSQSYEGYKGGDYTYDESTPLWVAPYGNCGRAIVDAKIVNGDIHLTTKEVD